MLLVLFQGFFSKKGKQLVLQTSLSGNMNHLWKQLCCFVNLNLWKMTFTVELAFHKLERMLLIVPLRQARIALDNVSVGFYFLQVQSVVH